MTDFMLYELHLNKKKRKKTGQNTDYETVIRLHLNMGICFYYDKTLYRVWHFST